MKLLEKTIYASIIFIVTYIILSLILRLFEFTEAYTSHMIGGIAATFLGVGAFMWMLIYKPKSK